MTTDDKAVTKALQDARDLISDPDRWCKFDFARTISDTTTSAHNPNAYKFCAVGALSKVSGTDTVFVQALTRLQKHTPDGKVTRVNDTGGHCQVMKLFARAIRDSR